MTQSAIVEPIDYRQLRAELIEIQKPFIQLLVNLYAKVVPKLLVRDGIVPEAIYPDWVQERDAEIRKHMDAATEHIWAKVRSR